MEFGRIRLLWKCAINGTQNSARGCRSSRYVGSLWSLGVQGLGVGVYMGWFWIRNPYCRCLTCCETAARLVLDLSPTNACMQANGWDNSAAKRSVDVTPEVNLRNPLCAGSKAHMQNNLPWPWNPGWTSPKSPKQGSVVSQKWLMSSENFQNKDISKHSLSYLQKYYMWNYCKTI